MRATKMRIITMIIAICLLISVAGCSGRSQDEDFPFSDGFDALPPAPAEHESLCILFPGYEPRNWDNVKAELEKRSAGALNVSLDFVWMEPYMYMSEVKAMAASNISCDALVIGKPDDQLPDFTKLAREGALKDITDIFPKSAPLLYSRYTPEELAYGAVDNRLFAVPSLCPQAICIYVMADDALLDKYGVKNIADYDEYEAFMKTVKDNEPDLYPGIVWLSSIITMAKASGYIVVDEMNMLVYKWDDPEMKIIAWEKTPEFFESANRMIEWYERGYLRYPTGNSDLLKTASLVYEDFLAMPADDTTTISVITPKGPKESNPMKIFRLLPDQPVQRENLMGNFYTSGSFIFPAASKNTERVLSFLQWVQQSRKNNYLIRHGIEGEDYRLRNGYPVLPDGMNSMSPSYMTWSGNWAFSNIEYEPGSTDAKDTPEEFLDKYAKYVPHKPFYPDYGTLQQAADDRVKAFTDFEQKLAQGHIKDRSEVDTFIKKLEELGSDKLVAEAQKQLEKK